MNRKNSISIRTGLIISLYFIAIHLSAQIYFDAYGFPVDEILLKEQFKDTIYLRDTLVIDDIETLVKLSKDNLAPFARKYGELADMVDSLNRVTEDRLYYNFYLSRDSAQQLSNRFIIKEYNMDLQQDRFVQSSDRTKDWDQLRDTSLIRKELLFHLDANSELTNAFLKNKLLIRKTLSRMFTIMAGNPDIVGINIFFPHYTFEEKREMVQFIKSVRILMDASEKFKPQKIRLNVTFLNRGNIDTDFSYCLLQEAGEVLYINSSDLIDRNYVAGTRITVDNIKNIRFLPQLKNHFYIVRYYTGNLDIRNQELKEFSEQSIDSVIQADYIENDWEIYLLSLILLFLLILFSILLYQLYVPFSALVNDNIESVLLIAIVLLLEILAIIVSIFRNMCYNDDFTFMHKNPAILFTLPLAMILIVPFLNGIAKKRRIP